MLTITIFSLVVAAASGLVAWRVVHREQRRSEARIAALALAIDEGPASSEAFGQREPNADRPVPVATLFDTSHPAGRRSRPLLTVIAGLAAVLTVVVLIAMTGDRYETPEAPAVPPRDSLELLSMGHTRYSTTLAVTGLVRNRSDQPADAVTAVVSALDRDGHIVARGSAPLTTLAPGAETPFVVTIPFVNDLARYRLSFRTSAGVVRHVDRRAALADSAS